VVGTGGAASIVSGQAAAAAAAAIAAANNDTVDSSKNMFVKKTKAIVWGMQTRAVQVINQQLRLERLLRKNCCRACWILTSFAGAPNLRWQLWSILSPVTTSRSSTGATRKFSSAVSDQGWL
jgi:hypothetical protein